MDKKMEEIYEGMKKLEEGMEELREMDVRKELSSYKRMIRIKRYD